MIDGAGYEGTPKRETHAVHFPKQHKLHGTLRIQEVSAVSAKESKTAWRRYSKHVIIYVFEP